MATKPPNKPLPQPIPGVNRRWDGVDWRYFNPATGETYANADVAKAAMGIGVGQIGGGSSGADSAAQQNAQTILTNLFDSYGLSSLAPKIMQYLKQGYSADAVTVLLQETPEYKARFKGNEARRAAGMAVLSPAEYLATESAYRQVMRAAGLPSGFYDQPDDFANFIGKDVSPTEVQERVTNAANLINNAPPEALAMFKQFYSTGDIIAYALDPTKAEPLVEKRLKAAELAGYGAQQGVGVGVDTAERMAGAGITSGQAQAGFGFIAGEEPNAEKLAAIYGDTIGQSDLVNEAFFNDAAATKKRSKLASKERATFGGSSGLSSQSLSRTDAGAV